MKKPVRNKWRIFHTPSLEAVELSDRDTAAIHKIIEAVATKHELSGELKKQLWGAIQQSKRSRQKFAILYRHRSSAADLKLLKTVKARCREVSNLLRQYTAEKTLSHPNGQRVEVATYLGTLGEIEGVAERTMLRESNWTGFLETLDEWYAGGVLADIYAAIFAKPATQTMPANGPGPFIRFVLAVYAELGLTEPSPASVRTWRLRFLKKRGHARVPRR